VQEISVGKLFWIDAQAIIVLKSGFKKSAHKLCKLNKIKIFNEY
tara:strand:- start:291 stop:422 length:132 start_codon:yes stop_codon:yes gene_type:complete